MKEGIEIPESVYKDICRLGGKKNSPTATGSSLSAPTPENQHLLEDYFFLTPDLSLDLDCGTLSDKTDVALQAIAEYLAGEFKTRRPLILMIGGPSATGKSSLAIELARDFGIRHIVGTDTLRHTLASCCASSPDILSLFSFQCWETVSSTYSPDALLEGFQAQCRALFDPIRMACLNSVRHVQNTVIEGVHLIPTVVNQLKTSIPAHVVPLYILASRERLSNLLIPKRTRSTYMHRPLPRYASRMEQLFVLPDSW